MDRLVGPVRLERYPPGVDVCFDLAEQAAEEADTEACFALSGLVVAAYDWTARLRKGGMYVDPPVTNYDLCVWLPEDEYDERRRKFAVHLAKAAASEICELSDAGDASRRYLLPYCGLKMSVSISPHPLAGTHTPECVATNQAETASLDILAVAITSEGRALATKGYRDARRRRRPNAYPAKPGAERRLEQDIRRVQEAFPYQVERLLF